MAWIDASQVAVLVRTDLSTDQWIDGLIDQAQGLAEVEIGEQDEPVSTGLQATLASIVARMWQAGMNAEVNPAALQQDQAGPFSMMSQHSGLAGLGLTNRERVALKRSAGMLGIGTLTITRGEIETAEVDPLWADGAADDGAWKQWP